MPFTRFTSLCGLLALAIYAVRAQNDGPPVEGAWIEPTSFLTYRTSKMTPGSPQPHHINMSLAWETKFKPAAQVAAYPFQSGLYDDFVPIFEELIKSFPTNTCALIDDDSWATPFVQPGKNLLDEANAAKKNGSTKLAYDLFLRAQVVFRISHFPWIGPGSTSTVKLETFELSKESIRSAMTVNDKLNFEEVTLSYDDKDKRDPDASKDFPVWIFTPQNKQKEALPTVLLVGGLGLNKPDQMESVTQLTAQGWKVVVVDMPGTGDAPITGRFTHLNSDEPLWQTLLTYFDDHPTAFDTKNLYVYGPSTAAYYTFRIAHLFADKFKAVVGQGGPVHWSFQQDWLMASRNLSYPCDLPLALGRAFGYETPPDFVQNAWKYSLVNQSMIGQKPSAQIISVTGVEDRVYPVDDSLLLSEYSSPTSAVESSYANGTERGCGAAPILKLIPGADNTGEALAFPWVEAYFQRVFNLIKQQKN